jgi:hypothetical protein
MSEFNWWLLIVGLVFGAGLVWLVLADSQRRESEISQAELPAEAAWIAETLEDSGENVDAATAERVLRLHRTYLSSLPPDEVEAGLDEVPDEMRDEASEAEPREEPAGTPPNADGQDVASRTPGTRPVWSATEPSPRRR